MIGEFLRCGFPIAFSVMLSANHAARADEPLVFISAFAAGDEGAIYAYQLDLSNGQLKQIHKTTDVEHPFFLPVSPNSKFLYSIHAKSFGGKEHEYVAAYEIGDDGRLTLLGIEPSLGKGPQNLAIAPDGKLLLCANMPGNNVTMFRINPKTGGLKNVGEPIEMTSPSCMMIPSIETE